MKKQTLTYSKTGFFSPLIKDYLSQSKKIESFYSNEVSLKGFKNQIKEKAQFPEKHRIVLVQALQAQYKNIETSSVTNKHINALRDANTFTITTGHQLNLFTGPLYFLYKIVSAINLAKKLKETYPSYNFVPVYWMASEDHDFEEINYFNFKGKKIQWNRKTSGAVGELNLEGLKDVYELFQNQLGLGDNANYLAELFKKAYLGHDNLADATLYLANQLFKDYGLVIIDANKKELKQLFIPSVLQELKQQTSFKNVLATSKHLNGLDEKYKIQVNPREINLFYTRVNLRERIVFKDKMYKILNTSYQFSESEIIDEINNYPERFSPNVILRPLYQEVILPNLCYVGGGGELAYWLQLKQNFKAFSIPFPILFLRNSVLLINKQQSEKLEKLKISVPDLFLKQNNLLEKYIKNISEIEIDLSSQKEHLKKQFKDLYELAKQTDTSFVGAVSAQERKQIKGLEYLEKRLLKAQSRKLKTETNRVLELQNQLFVNENLQERQANFSEFYLEYGTSLITTLIKNLDPLDLKFTVLTV